MYLKLILRKKRAKIMYIGELSFLIRRLCRLEIILSILGSIDARFITVGDIFSHLNLHKILFI